MLEVLVTRGPNNQGWTVISFFQASFQVSFQASFQAYSPLPIMNFLFYSVMKTSYLSFL